MKKTFRVTVTERKIYRYECEVDPGTPEEMCEQAENEFLMLDPAERAKLPLDHKADDSLWQAEPKLLD